MSKYQHLILGASTWGIGDVQDDWFDGLTKLENTDLSGKTVALFGTGDPQGSPDSFVDALGVLYEKIIEQGAKVIGFWPTDGYEFDASKAEREGRFEGSFPPLLILTP